ncbi:MAG: hypothetical protein A2Y40_04695 [Candidatus Margulisbacteria bacterium GWF2_35_9]|nr:MAG: hypothetical protein A2Y40_04695 [Candidatus Margulisbacteria bacterium GWF2_35_9]
MLNSLDAREGNDFDFLNKDDIKGKLTPSLIAFWEVVESSQMDIFIADGHPLGRTFRFKINVNDNKNYPTFFEQVKKEPLYDEYHITIDETIPEKELIISFELITPKKNIDL